VPTAIGVRGRPGFSLLFDVFVLGQRVRELLASTMGDSPLRPEEYAIYSVIFEAESLTPTQMAATLSMPLTTVADHLRLMEARGHAQRIRNPRDGRSYLVVLTADGLRMHREANRGFERAYAALVATLPMGEAEARRQLGELLTATEQARKKFGAAPEGAAPMLSR
jgi:DNA-binding MarR family transcriptional regulator